MNRAVDIINEHCVKIVRIKSFYGLYFTTFDLYTKICRVISRTQSECGKIGTRKTQNMDIFHAVETVAKFSKTLRSKNIAVKTEFRDLQTRPFTHSLAGKLKKTADFLFVKHHAIRIVLGNFPMHLDFLPWSFSHWLSVLVLCKSVSK